MALADVAWTPLVTSTTCVTRKHSLRLHSDGRKKAPKVSVKKILVEIDPYSDHDRLSVA